MRLTVSALSLFAVVSVLEAQSEKKWWMDQPVRLVQTNLRETDAALDANYLIQQVAALPANALLIGMGGITAYYPTKVRSITPAHLYPQGLTCLAPCYRRLTRSIRVIGRLILVRHRRRYMTHPEWFFRRANGEPVIYNGLYSTCINGDYYRKASIAILAEALERYPVDGLFFNMFGNPSADYSGNPVGLCHCDACKETSGSNTSESFLEHRTGNIWSSCRLPAWMSLAPSRT